MMILDVSDGLLDIEVCRVANLCETQEEGDRYHTLKVDPHEQTCRQVMERLVREARRGTVTNVNNFGNVKLGICVD